MAYVLQFGSDEASLPSVGGKGLNLSRLYKAGLPVPPGFLLTTEAYSSFVRHNRLRDRVIAAASEAVLEDPASQESASAEIRGAFAAGVVPGALRSAIVSAYEELSRESTGGQGPEPVAVAVRSSATAEDLPGLSFAGQQETFLNVQGQQQLIEAVKKCWSSLWSARAIGYRLRNRIRPEEVELAVVVQEMVAAEASGVTFTANPVTGRRDEAVIDASFGLGEAVVSGRVDPDRYVVRPLEGRIVEVKRGEKALVVVSKAGGGTSTVAADGASRQALPDDRVLELATLAAGVSEMYGSPQDIEWAWADGRFYLLQARPITALYPVPDELARPDQLRAYASFNSVQGLSEPLTPLGAETLQKTLGAVPRTLDVERPTGRLLAEAGCRLFLDITDLARDRRLRVPLLAMLSRADPIAKRVVDGLLKSGRIEDGESLRPRHVRRLLRLAPSLLGRLALAMISPETARARAEHAAEALIFDARRRVEGAPDLQSFLHAMDEVLGRAAPLVLRQFFPMIASGIALMARVDRWLVEWSGAEPGSVLPLVRGLPGNVTSEMDLRLWSVAQQIRAVPEAARELREAQPSDLAHRYEREALAVDTATPVRRFLDRYGVRGPAEIDIGRQRWKDDPVPVLAALQGYLGLEDPRLAPDVLFAEGARLAREMALLHVEAARLSPGGAIKGPVLRFAIDRMRRLLAVRESPKFFMVRLWDVFRRGFLHWGERLAGQGALNRADDVFFVTSTDLWRFAADQSIDLRVVAERNRREFEAEMLRRQVPRILLSTGESFYDASLGDSEGALLGEPVSPGTFEGTVRVVLDPRGARVAPGDVLVCPATDPGWTPLFLTAGALVMEMGGLVTHGAVVAREYGIPAVVGIAGATTRLRTGQRVRVDGSTGTVTLLEDAPVG